jgi:DNA-binding MarR family transcriptional regulator
MKIEELIQQKKFLHNGHKAIINLIYTYHWLSKQMEDVFDSFQITQQQFNVLRILRGRFPNSATAGEVKEVMLDKSPDLTRLCDRLLKKKWIERATNEKNRRQIFLKITQEGLDLLEMIDNQMLKLSENFKNLSEQEFEQLSELLDKLRG